MKKCFAAATLLAALLLAGGLQAAMMDDEQVIIPPYTEEWAEGSFDNYIVVDGNQDGRTWGFDKGMARYSYSTRNAADDWLISPEIYLDAGKVYELTALAQAVSDSYSERIAILLGQGTDPTAYDKVVVDSTDLVGSTPVTLSNTFSVEKDGYYRVAFHAVSDKNHFYLALRGWTLDVLVESGAPDVVSDLWVTPGAKGARTATVGFTTPSTTVGGEPLTELSSVEVRQGGKVLATIDQPTPGTPMEVEVTVDDDGLYEFAVVASNAIGAGMSARASAYVGFDVPLLTGEVNCVDLRDDKMACSWTASGDVGENGGYVDTTAVTYQLYALNDKGNRDELLATTDGTTYVADYSFWDWGTPDLLRVQVTPVFAEKEGAPIFGKLIIGKPAEIPYKQSFGKTSQGGVWWQEATGGLWETHASAADEDGKSLRFVAGPEKASGRIMTQKLSLKGAAHPMLLFQYAGVKGQNLCLHVLADRQDDNGPVLLKTILPEDVTETGWVQEGIDLTAFVNDDYVIIHFLVEAAEMGATINVDDICVRDVSDCDLEVVSIVLPKTVRVGNEEKAYVTVRNNGLWQMEEGTYEIALAIGMATDTIMTEVKTLSPFQGKVTYTFTFKPSIFDETMIQATAHVVCDGDVVDDNNVATTTAIVKQPSVARMNNLTAEVDGSDVALAWELPSDAFDQSNIITEDFEDMTSFVPMSVGGITADTPWGAMGAWKLYDGNGTSTHVVEGCDSCDNMGAPMAFMVFNAHDAGLDMTDYDVVERWASYSGEQMLLAMTPDAEGTPSDKWIVSPLLSGGEQTIDFFVGATAEGEGTTFEVWYSNTDTDLEHFQVIYKGEVTSPDWTEVQVVVPFGTKYFAVRSTASGTAGLKLDDITFATSSTRRMPSAQVYLSGCNVYRDGQWVATLDADKTEYLDTQVPDGTHKYHVTALYGTMESGLSNPAIVEVDVTGMPSIMAERTIGSDYLVYSTSGTLLGHGQQALASLPKGVYIVKDKATGKAAKIFKR